MASQHRASSAGPFTVRCPTCPPIPADMFRIASQLTCPRQRSFRGPGTSTPVSGQLPSNGRLEEQPRSLWFPVGFRPPAFASWASCSRQGLQPPLRSAYRRPALRPAHRTRTGFPRSARARPGWDWVPSVSRGQRCPHGRRCVRDRRLPHLSGSVPVRPPPHPDPGGSSDETSPRVSCSHPMPSLLLTCGPRTVQGPLGFP
jgi:hypothetical protein